MAKRKSTPDDALTRTKPRPKRPKRGPIETANALEPEDFQTHFLDEALLTYGSKEETEQSKISLHFVKDLTPDLLSTCFNLIETTSRSDYSSSAWGWHPTLKRREMREPEMRYFIVTSLSTTSTDTFEGFLSIMLTHDSTPSVPVLYIYEVHLTAKARGKGLGKHLMVLAEDIARRAGVAKVMLTCFKSNVNARTFYTRLGYITDVSSPRDIKTRGKIHKHDYVIMSKELMTGIEEEAHAVKGVD